MRLRALLIAASCATFALSPLACASAEDDSNDTAAGNSDEDTSGADEIRAQSIDESSNGKTVTLAHGQNLIIKLHSNPTTGYQWRVVSTDRTFGYPEDKFVKNSDGAVGSGGIQKLTWKLNGPLDESGTHKIKLEYKRASGAADKTFELTIKVLPKSCPELTPPAPSFCKNGRITPKRDADGCTTSYECVADCRTNGCGGGSRCQICWANFACVPNGAMC
jgi:predicted secreted protein